MGNVVCLQPNKEWKRKRRKKRRTTTSNSSSSNRLKSPLPLGTPPSNDENGNTNQIEESRLPTTKSASASAADGAKQHHQQQQMAPPLRPATEAAADLQQRHRHGQKAKEEEMEGPSTSSSAFGSSTGDLQLAEASSDLQLPLASKPATDDGINHCSTLAGPSSSCPVVDAAVANGTPPAGADPPNIDGLQSWRATPLLADCQMPSQLLIPAPTAGSKLAAPPPLLAPSLSLRRHHAPLTEANPQKDDLLQPQQHLSASPAGSSLLAPCSASSCSAGSLGSILASNKSRIFPSTRFFIALLLCLCYVSLSISTSNISVSMVCMIRKAASPPAEVPEFNVLAPLEELINAQEREKSDVLLFLRRRRSSGPASANLTADSSTNNTMNSTAAGQQRECDWNRVRKHVTEAAGGEDNSNRSRRLTVLVESCHEAEKLAWGSTDQGIVFAAQNAGSLLMLFTGAHADRLNSKWTIAGALALLVLSNAVLPLVASMSVWLVVVARLMTGLSDALLQPSTSSLITRWFPPKERPFAIGLITGGRQIGTLLILPLAGFLCSRQDIAGGWPAIFYLSSLIGSAILLVWLLMSADKPSKHFCTSRREQSFVEQKIAEERLGKRTERRRIPWRRLATCGPLHVGVAALICHEYPLVIMLQLLPKYINDVLHLSNLTNGIVSALPIAVLFISKTFSASASSYIQARKKGRFLIGRTALAKWFNGVASLGLGLCVGIVPLLNTERWVGAIVVLCLANAFAGLHTPGVQTALLQIAPAYTGIITGIAFGCVAIFGIINKILSNFILQSGSLHEWTIVFWIAAVIALLPVGFFSLWGSAERQPWASTRRPSVLSKKNNAEHGNGSRVFPADSLTGGKDGGIFVIGQQSEKSQETCLDKCGRAEQGRTDEDEEEEEDSDSAHFEPEAAVASALRLQMFWGHPGGGAEEEEEEEEGDGQFLHDILQAHAQAAWKVNNAVQRQMNGSSREEQQETSSRTTAPAAEDVVPAGIGRRAEEKL